LEGFTPKHLTQQQIDQIYAQALAGLEAMHIQATITVQRNAAHGDNMWDTDKGEEFIDSVRQQWHADRGGPPED
jgi:hypothetical protein